MSREFPQLSTDRLLLRSMVAADAPGYAELLSDPATHPFITESGPVPASETPGRIRDNVRAFEEARSIYWSVELGGQFVAYVALHEVGAPCPVVSYAVRPACRRQGIATEALQAVCSFSFATLRAQAVVARTHVDNSPSADLLLSVGFEKIGCVSTAQGERVEFRLPAE